jgi:hypothetical protein
MDNEQITTIDVLDTLAYLAVIVVALMIPFRLVKRLFGSKA